MNEGQLKTKILAHLMKEQVQNFANEHAAKQMFSVSGVVYAMSYWQEDSNPWQEAQDYITRMARIGIVRAAIHAIIDKIEHMDTEDFLDWLEEENERERTRILELVGLENERLTTMNRLESRIEKLETENQDLKMENEELGGLENTVEELEISLKELKEDHKNALEEIARLQKLLDDAKHGALDRNSE